jgi:N,N'-diacetylchitobiose transport system permease protein
MKARRRRTRFVWDAIGVLVFVVIAFPVYWMIASAFKSNEELNSLTPTWFSMHPTLSHFGDAIHRPFFWDGVKNSLIVVSVTVALSMVCAFLAAIALAKFRFTGRKLFIVLIIGIQMLPQAGLIIPLYVVLARYHQVNALSGVIVTYMTFVLPFSVWMLRGFLLGIPKDLEEAAMVDGSSRVGSFTRILLPLVAPGLVATSIFAFIQAWNEYLMASVLVHSPGNQTLTLWLAGFITDRGTAWGPLMAGATLTALPVVLFFVAIQRRIAFGLTAGAVRG